MYCSCFRSVFNQFVLTNIPMSTKITVAAFPLCFSCCPHFSALLGNINYGRTHLAFMLELRFRLSASFSLFLLTVLYCHLLSFIRCYYYSTYDFPTLLLTLASISPICRQTIC